MMKFVVRVASVRFFRHVFFVFILCLSAVSSCNMSYAFLRSTKSFSASSSRHLFWFKRCHADSFFRKHKTCFFRACLTFYPLATAVFLRQSQNCCFENLKPRPFDGNGVRSADIGRFVLLNYFMDCGFDDFCRRLLSRVWNKFVFRVNACEVDHLWLSISKSKIISFRKNAVSR